MGGHQARTAVADVRRLASSQSIAFAGNGRNCEFNHVAQITAQNLRNFAIWLKEAISELEEVRACPERDPSMYDYTCRLLRVAQQHARVVGAQELCEQCKAGSPEAGLDVLGTCLAWCLEHLPPGEKPFLTVEETAARLRLSTKKVYEMCASGELPSYRAGRAIRISQADVERFEAPRPTPSRRRAIGKQHI